MLINFINLDYCRILVGGGVGVRDSLEFKISIEININLNKSLKFYQLTLSENFDITIAK